jgi:hypothetical protein
MTMLRRMCLPAICVLSMWLAPTGTARAEVKQVMTARIRSQISIQAPAAPIWLYATQGRNFAAWMPEWNQPRNAKINLVKVGDWLDSVDEWNNKGRSVVTFADRNREIRIANDPLNGSFMCQTRLRLDPGPEGTIAQLTEQYTDESQPADFSATALKMQAAMDRALAALKAGVERRRGAGGGERR